VRPFFPSDISTLPSYARLKKLRNATVSFITAVCRSVRPHGETRPSNEGEFVKILLGF